MIRKQYIVDRMFDTSGWGNTGTKVNWVLVDISSRKVLEKSELFFEFFIKVLSKYDENTVSFDKVFCRSDIKPYLKQILDSQKPA